MDRFLHEALRCSVCGFGAMRTDATPTDEGAGWLLAECPRCEHRLTRPLREPSPARPAAVGRSRALREVASAA